MQDVQNFRTSGASNYLASRGVAASPSLLEKFRNRGAEDSRDRGPDYFRDERGICWYSRASLNQYVDVRLAARKFRGSASQPEHFRGSRRGTGQAA